MSKEADVAKRVLDKVKLPGQIISMVNRTRTEHWCHQGKHTIQRGTSCFKIEQAGGSVRALKFPDYVCIDCMSEYIESEAEPTDG